MLSRFFSRSAKPHPPIDEEEKYAATTENLRKLLGKCPKCSDPLAGHSYAEYAQAAGKDDMDRLLSGYEANRWQELREIQSFNGLQNALIAYAIRCEDGHGSIVVIVSTAELWDSDQLISTRALTSEEWLRLLQATPELHWHPF
jgi:hypothetical protein